MRLAILTLAAILLLAGCLQSGPQAGEDLGDTHDATDENGPDPEATPSSTEDQGRGTAPENGSMTGQEDSAEENTTAPGPGSGLPPEEASGEAPKPKIEMDLSQVVVATFDTGTNPFHPCFRQPNANASKAGIPGFPSDARSLELTFKDDYASSLEASQNALDAIESGVLHHVPETHLLFYGEPTEFIDDYPHGAQASSQIICPEYGLAPEAWLVILNWYDDTADPVAYLHWVAEQDWIDVVHLNIQDLPVPLNGLRTQAIKQILDSGKMVVIAAGNGAGGSGASYPMELSSYNGPVGSLIAGANENQGYEVYTNLNPHVVMDGCATPAAAPDSFDEGTFSGTSSASPRITGYVTRLLLDVRAEYADVLGSGSGLVTLKDPARYPDDGPLTDGSLTVAELHEVVRKTADPNPHESWMDGDNCIVWWIPQPGDLPYSFYPKMGYGEVSEYTLDSARAVLFGRTPMPDRPVADQFYQTSTAFRETYWG